MFLRIYSPIQNLFDISIIFIVIAMFLYFGIISLSTIRWCHNVNFICALEMLWWDENILERPL